MVERRSCTLGIALACLASGLLIAAISPSLQAGQVQAPSSVKFDVAAIRECRDEDFSLPSGQRRQEYTATPGRIEINCIPLDRIIFFAYASIGDLEHPLLNNSPSNPDVIRGGPGWILGRQSAASRN